MSVRIRRGWHTAYIALGSNLGEKQSYIQSALDGMADNEFIRVKQTSTLITTAPYGGVEQDEFLNGVCADRNTLYPGGTAGLVSTCWSRQPDRERKVHLGAENAGSGYFTL